MVQVRTSRAGSARRLTRMAVAGDIQFSPSTARLLNTDPVKLFASASLSVANLETVISDRGYPNDKVFNLRTSPGAVSVLKRLNCRVLSFANNHAYDFGEQAFLDTIALVKEAGIQLVGAGKDFDDAKAPVNVDAGGLSVSFIAFSCVNGPGSRAAASKPGTFQVAVESYWQVNGRLLFEQPGTPPVVMTRNSAPDVEMLRRVVRTAKKGCDMLVVLPHWGVGYRYELMDYQRELSREIIDAGADLIVGSNAHLIQAAERRSHGVVFYSLGDFVFQHEGEPNKTKHRPPLWRVWSKRSIMLDVELGMRRVDFTVRPLLLDRQGIPRFAGGEEGERILATLQELSRLEGTKLSIKNGACGLSMVLK